jgi:hypothetical protein
MIILARPVAYGGNAARYAMEKEDATVVKVNHMPDYLDATEIWYRMKHHCQLHQQDRTVGRKLERFMTTFVLSPSKEESENYTLDDWANLADEGLEALDSVGLLPKGFKEKVKTNFRNSMSVAALHRDSKSGTLHLHLDCCRVDNDGKTNDVHDVHIRAIRAAEIINARHGWEQPQEVREMRQQDIAEFCEYTLQKMDSFDIDRYFDMLRMRGYEVNPRYDTTNCKLVGYTIGKNASVFKASAIGRKFMVSQLIFLNEVQVPDSDMTASREDISHVGMLLFLDMIDAATTVSESCGGGGSAPSSGWGKDDDEDERERARRCLQMAHAMCKPPQKRRSFHR